MCRTCTRVSRNDTIAYIKALYVEDNEVESVTQCHYVVVYLPIFLFYFHFVVEFSRIAA